MKFHNDKAMESLTPQQALHYLKEGNKRFYSNLRYNRNFLQQVSETADGQSPFAAILSCSDSRVSSELIFDQGLGDIFSVRLAGNIASTKAIASIEYTCKVLGTKLIIVLGHTNCGAVKAACDKVEMGNIGSLMEHIYPAVEREQHTIEGRGAENKEFVQNVAYNNVLCQIETIINDSHIIRELLANHEIGIAGGMYDISNGIVEFFDETFDTTDHS